VRHFLFICSRNKLRSPTAEAIFSGRRGVQVTSAGLNKDAAVPVTSDLIKWADQIYVMETRHVARLKKRFGVELGKKKVACLGIPDRYGYMDPKLVSLLERRVGKDFAGNSAD
jgi:predicted protein tyrosine phosphatase